MTASNTQIARNTGETSRRPGLKISVNHSPDSDDAFLFYGLRTGNVECAGVELDYQLNDIQSLNLKALRQELDLTAASVHALAFCSESYFVMRSGGSFGGANYGPCIISVKDLILDSGRKLTIASPGDLTSSSLALRIFLRENNIPAQIIEMDFKRVGDAVTAGEVDAGVLIHEGQVTFEREGFCLVKDLGVWWNGVTGLPLPLGVNIVKKSFGTSVGERINAAVRESILFALRYREEALEYSMKFSRGLTIDEVDKYVGMYVNDMTVDMGELGMKAIKELFQRGSAYGIVPEPTLLEFV
jgi:1,4-dihydroxy-6-naphthoate synthase